MQRTDTRRIAALFRPYRRRLFAVLALIALSATLSMVSPFLLREILDVAIPQRDTTLLTWLVLGMIGVSIVHRRPRGRADVAVEPRRPARHARPARGRLPPPAAAVAGVLHAHAHGRGAVADRQRHRRRAERRHVDGDVDRLQRDHGARDRRRRCSRSTGAWPSFSLALLPFFVWLTRRVGDERKRITTERQGRLADMSALVEESLSVSGILLGKTMGRGDELTGASSASPPSSPTSRCSAAWPAAGGWRACR